MPPDSGSSVLASNPADAMLLVLVLGIGSLVLAWKIRFPSILLLLLSGLAVGPIGLDLFRPDDFISEPLLFAFVSASVAIILFEGGMSLRWHELTAGAIPMRRLIWLGLPIGLVLAGTAFGLIYQVRPAVAAMIGAVLVITGPTVIGPILRQVRPKGRVGSLVKWEGILNDPIGAVIAVVLLEFVLSTRGDAMSGSAIGAVLVDLSVAVGIGVVAGVGVTGLLVLAIRSNWLPAPFQGIVTLVATITTYFLCDRIQHESGLLAVTVAGAVLGNQQFISVRRILAFNEHLRDLLISVLFIILAARLHPEQLLMLDWRAGLLLGLLVLVVRPASVALSTYGTDLPLRERLFVMFMAPRGIVVAAMASLIALRLHATDPDLAAILEPLIYLLIIGSVAIYGIAARPLAHLLKLTDDSSRSVLIVGAHDWARDLANLLIEEGFDVLMVDSDRWKIRSARLAGINAQQFSILDQRFEEELDIQRYDNLLALTSSDEANAVAALRCADLIDGGKVSQLAAGRNKEGPPGRFRSVRFSTELSGDNLFAGGRTFDEISSSFAKGGAIKVTRLSDDFTLADYRRHYRGEQIELLQVTKTGGLTGPPGSATEGLPAGTKIIAIVPDDEDGRDVEGTETAERSPASAASS